jgi:DNA modification methylase
MGHNEFKLKYHEPSIIFYDVFKASHLHKCKSILLEINVNKKKVQIIFKMIPAVINYNYNLFTKITFQHLISICTVVL